MLVTRRKQAWLLPVTLHTNQKGLRKSFFGKRDTTGAPSSHSFRVDVIRICNSSSLKLLTSTQGNPNLWVKPKTNESRKRGKIQTRTKSLTLFHQIGKRFLHPPRDTNGMSKRVLELQEQRIDLGQHPRFVSVWGL